MATKEQLLNAKERAEKEYKTLADRFPNVAGHVIGIGIGPKITEDEPKKPEVMCLRFYVERKIRPEETIHEQFRINDDRYGVPTDVIETGRIVSFQGGPGSSIGFDERGLPANVDPAATGTLGAVVALGGKHYVLGSNHAMAVNGRATGARIAFRPPKSLIDDPEKYIFGHITDHVHLTQAGPNTLDCALAQIDDKFIKRVRAEFPNRIVTSSDGIEPDEVKPDNVRRVALVDEIEKAPTGKIVYVGARQRFDLSFGSFVFEKLVVIEGDDNEWNLPFAKPGDSGAVVVGLDEHGEYRATAIVIGGARRKSKNGPVWKNYTFACSFKGALAALEKEVVRRLGMVKRPDETPFGADPGLRLVFSLPEPEPEKPASSTAPISTESRGQPTLA